MSLAIEVAELMEVFQWLTIEASYELKNDTKKMAEVKDELADVAVYLFNLSNVLNIDLSKAIEDKLIKNSEKYPVELVKGKIHKYSHYIRK
jgi:NTP pyrophosphatase (non-canonical NTP hydrolase)